MHREVLRVRLQDAVQDGERDLARWPPHQMGDET